MFRPWVILLLLLPLGLACSSPSEVHREQKLNFQSPVLDRTYSPGQGPRTKQEVQLSNEYPVGAWLRGVRVEAAPKESLESVEISFVDSERHFNVLKLEQGVASIWRFPNSPEFGDGGIPIRSNEPLWVELCWGKTDPYSPSHSAKAELTLIWTTEQPSTVWRTVEDDDGYLKLEVEKQFEGFPERLY